jgi:DNA-binding transcriptional LysR family regulator
MRRVRVELVTDASLTTRTLGHSRRVLVASPSLANGIPASDIAGLANLPTLSSTDEPSEIVWDLLGPDGAIHTQRHEPRMTSGDFAALRDAAAAGLGVALLPDHACRSGLASGRLVRLFPDWSGQNGIVHVIFTTMRGLPPAVRAFINHLAAAFAD